MENEDQRKCQLGAAVFVFKSVVRLQGGQVDCFLTKSEK